MSDYGNEKFMKRSEKTSKERIDTQSTKDVCKIKNVT